MVPRSNEAILIFLNVIERSLNLVTESEGLPGLYNAVERLKRSGIKWTYENIPLAMDMTRAGIVLSVAAMDDYFIRKYSQSLIPCIRTRGVTDDLAKALTKGGLDVKQCLELLAMERPYRRVRKIAHDYYSTYSAQRIDKIDALIGTLGLANLSKHAQQKSRRRSLLKSIQKLVKRRNEIVHGGDLNRQGKLQKISVREVKNRIRAVMVFVSSADEIIDNYVKKQRQRKE